MVNKLYFTDYYFKEEKIPNWNKTINFNDELKAAIKVLKKINELGYEALIVGGTPRDLLLGKEISDVDIATSAPIQELEKHFKNHNIGKNKDFNVIVIDVDGYSFEVAAYRSDVYDDYSKGVGATKTVIAKDFKSDSARRDLGMNSLGVDVDGNIKNHWGGVQDIQNKIVKAVGDPNLRFKEDQIRTMRAVRFASRLGFSIDQKTIDAIKSNAPEIKKVAAERISKELLKMAEQPGYKFAKGIELLDESGLLKYILPDLYGLKSMKHNPIQHPEGGSNVLGHVLEALKTVKESDPTLNMCVLLHDIGKSTTWGAGNTYHGHASASIPIIEKISNDLKLNNEMKNAIMFTAENHMKVGDFLKMSNSKIAQLMNNKYFDLLMKVAEADWKARGDELFDKEEWDNIQKKLEFIKSKSSGKSVLDSIRKVVNGKLVKRIRPDIKPSKLMGDIIDGTIEWIIDNNISLEDIKSIDDYIKNYK